MRLHGLVVQALIGLGGLEQIDNRAGIVNAKLDGEALLFDGLELPGFMHLARGESRQLWQPVFDVDALGVVILRLLQDVEEPEATGVITDPCGVIPVAVVAAYVVVHQQGLKPLSAHAPIDTQVLRQKARNVLSATVIKPLAASSRMLASTRGNPVLPSRDRKSVV